MKKEKLLNKLLLVAVIGSSAALSGNLAWSEYHGSGKTEQSSTEQSATQPRTMTVNSVDADNNSIEVRDDNGNVMNMKVAKSATIQVAGSPAKLSDFSAGDTVKVTAASNGQVKELTK